MKTLRILHESRIPRYHSLRDSTNYMDAIHGLRVALECARDCPVELRLYEGAYEKQGSVVLSPLLKQCTMYTERRETSNGGNSTHWILLEEHQKSEALFQGNMFRELLQLFAQPFNETKHKPPNRWRQLREEL